MLPIVDNTPPVITAQNITVNLGASGNVNIIANQISTVTDNCGNYNVTIDLPTLNCDNLGENTVTITATDAAGNVSTATAVVTVQDITPPTVVTKNITKVLTNGRVTITAAEVLDFNCGTGGISVPQPVPGAGDDELFFARPCTSDNCSIVFYDIDKKSFDCTNAGVNIVTATVRDQSGNVTTATATVTIIDNSIPTVKAKDITVELDENGNATITPQMIDNGSSGACGNVNLSLNKTTFDCSNVGTNQVTLIATNGNGVTRTAVANVTVVDNIAPVVVTKNITLNLDQYGQASIADALDLLVLCDDANIEIPTDNGGGGGGWVPGPGQPSFFVPAPFVEATCTKDNCTIVSVTADITDFNCTNLGQNTVNVTVTDASGNSTTETAIVTINDIIAPTVITKNISVNLDANGNATITPQMVDNGSADNCEVTLSLDKDTFNCDETGVQTVVLTATDASGNTTSSTASVTVADVTVPTVITKNITVALDANGNANITPQQVDNGSFDNCNIVLSVDKTAFDCNTTGEQTVTLTGTDPSGNTASATAIVTVVDNTPPVITAQNITVNLGASGNVNIIANQISTVTDNCGNYNVTIDLPTLNCDNLGENTVTITATDAAGNVSTATAVVTVQDITPPTVVTKNITKVLTNGRVTITAAEVLDFNCGTGGISVPQPVPGAGDDELFFARPCTSDNCSIVFYDIDKKNFDCTNAGVNIVTATVRDQSGNVTTATATVTIIDNSIPTVKAKDITVELDENGNATITPQMIDNGSTGACGNVNLSLNKTTFDCSNVGTNQVTLIATNGNGVTRTAVANVTVVDNIAPVVVTKNITLNLDQYGQASIADALDLLVLCDDANIEIPTDNGGGGGGWVPGPGQPSFFVPAPFVEATCTKDNCTIVSVTADITDFNCTNLGQNTVNVTVTDASGNSTTETAIVTINDIIAPTVITKNIYRKS